MPSANLIELVNEALTMLCTYFMAIFQALELDPKAKYATGWYLVAVILFMVILNMSFMIVQTIQNALLKCRLRIKRKRNQRLVDEKIAMRKLLQEKLKQIESNDFGNTIQERFETKKGFKEI